MKTDHIFKYNSSEYKDFLKSFRSNSSQKENKIIVFAGDFDADRQYAIDELKRESFNEILEIDLSDIIRLDEKKSFANIDAAIDDIGENTGLVVFRNGAILNGAYTGFTASAVKYATPQEKYFLKKIKQIQASLVIELADSDQLDRTLVRSADAVVVFSAPTSAIDKFFWKLRNIHVHGSRFISPRTT